MIFFFWNLSSVVSYWASSIAFSCSSSSADIISLKRISGMSPLGITFLGIDFIPNPSNSFFSIFCVWRATSSFSSLLLPRWCRLVSVITPHKQYRAIEVSIVKSSNLLLVLYCCRRRLIYIMELFSFSSVLRDISGVISFVVLDEWLLIIVLVLYSVFLLITLHITLCLKSDVLKLQHKETNINDT